MNQKEWIPLRRDCEATQIPSGNKLFFPKETLVRVGQSLGGNFTVVTQEGYMARIEGKDADALGESAGSLPQTSQAPQTPLSQEEIEKRVWGQLRTVFDPEIPVNAVDLGLIYKCEVTPLPEFSDRYRVYLQMTLTAPGCGMGGVLQADAQAKISAIPGVKQVQVDISFDPPWNPSLMSEAARLQLGML